MTQADTELFDKETAPRWAAGEAIYQGEVGLQAALRERLSAPEQSFARLSHFPTKGKGFFPPRPIH